MLRFSKWKTLAVIALALASILYSLPSAFSPAQQQAFEKSLPTWAPKWLIPHKGITLGLDLQGGTHVVLEVDQTALVRRSRWPSGASTT